MGYGKGEIIHHSIETDYNTMIKEKIEPSQEKKEEFEEIQRLELDPDEGVDIVIKKIPGGSFSRMEDFDVLRYLPPGSGRARYFPARVILEKNGEIIKDFQEEVPAGTKFYFREMDPKKKGKKDKAWGHFRDSHRTTMPQKWTNNKYILALVHENGHAHYWFKHPEEIDKKEELERQEEEIGLQLYSIGERGAMWHREEPGGVPDLKLATNKEKENLIKESKEITQKIILSDARSERGAWAEGLNLVRKIKREKGIDLLKPFRGKNPEETRKNIEAFIHGYALSAKEEKLREAIKELGLSQEIEGAFTKKYKEKSEEISKEVSEEASKI